MLKAEIYLSILAENEEKFLAEIAVAPLVGAWIEIDVAGSLPDDVRGRSPRGSVD